MVRSLLLLFIFFLANFSPVLAQNIPGRLQGIIYDKSTREPVPFANVVVSQNGVQRTGGTSDFEGNFDISPLTAGTYDVTISVIGYQRQIINGVVIGSAKTTRLNNIELAVESSQLDEVVIIDYAIPLIDADNTTEGSRLLGKDIEKLPSRSLAAITTTQAGVFSSDDGRAINIRGNRSDATQYMVNGVKIYGPAPNVPVEAIAELQIITGGVPAQFGDVVGGIINITTRSASSEYFGGLIAETSRPFDSYRQDILSGSLSGPILSRQIGGMEPGTSRKKTVLGFFATAQYQGGRDFAPPHGGTFKLRDEVRQSIEAAPIRRSGAGNAYASELVTFNDLERTPFRLDNERQNYLFNATMDYQPTDNILVTVGGNYTREDGRTAAGGQPALAEFASVGANTGPFYQNSLFNSENNARRRQDSWNAFARFTQSFRRPAGDTSASVISNAYYQLQFDYSNFYSTVGHPEFDGGVDDIFRYRYMGQFEQRRRDLSSTEILDVIRNELGVEIPQIPFTFQQLNAFGDTIPGGRVTLNGSRAQPLIIRNGAAGGVGFTPSGDNAIMANYTSQLLALEGDNILTYNQLLQRRGLLNGIGPSSTYSIWASPGAAQNSFFVDQLEQYRFSGFGNANVGNHALKIGFEIEQRVQSNYSVSSSGVWGLGSSLLNQNLVPFFGLAENGIEVQGDTTFVTLGTFVNRTADGGVNRNTFDRNLRSRLGLSPDGNDVIDIYSLDPSVLSMDLFAANDLLRNRTVSYRGYDHTGQRQRGASPSFADFFLDTLNRPQDSFRPVYAAAFIEDKFEINDLIVRVGLRVDRYDANQQVLRDPYSLTRLTRVGEVDFSQFRGNPQLPSTVGDDFAIFVDRPAESANQNEMTVVGFRSGDVFFDRAGQQIENPNGVINPDGQVYPFFNLQESERALFNQTRLTLDAFEDYRPQINVMPRVSFSFPISEDALFFAHYDVLTQRPTRNALNPNDFFLFFQDQQPFLNNPDLRPQRTIDYALGFQQRLTRSSALKFSAFYKELRDQVQVTNVFFAYPKTYQTFRNLDFGTVKGLTLQYDLRRTNHLALNANYTLQFAEGTSSGDLASFDLIRFGQPNLRVPTPLDFDQRHAFKVNLDYRYEDNEGPVLFGKRVLENFGVNFTIFAGSGTPYSRTRGNPNRAVATGVQEQTRLSGQINSSRLPWQQRSSLRVNKVFAFTPTGGGRPKTLDVYVYIQNVFNVKNVLSVYRFTGQPDDDGFLSSQVGQQFTSLQLNPDAFFDLYTLRMNDPGNFSLPRQTRVGLAYSF